MEFLRVSSSQFASELSGFQLPRKHYSYGTAGFRDRYDETVHSIFYKVGIIAALRSLAQGGKAVGVMVTASHNALPDNGVKIVDANGGMMSQAWEGFAEQVVNLHDIESFTTAVQYWIDQDPILSKSSTQTPTVVVGRDCRWHSPILSKLVIDGVRAFTSGTHAIIVDVSEVTTPVVHFVVADYNSTDDESKLTYSADQWKTRYFQTLTNGYQSLIQTSTESSLNQHETLVLDCAFGVGSKTVSEFLAIANTLTPWTLSLINPDGAGEVNALCGAEYVQKGQLAPAGMLISDIESKGLEGKLLCSFDGDGDRIVFHAYLANNQWILLDGDRIATLIALFLFQELSTAGLLKEEVGLRAGVVQTAYANGSSGQFLRNKGVEVLLAKTGVKFIHHKAEELDIGIYFEANGHGTVLFSDKFKTALKDAVEKDTKEDDRKTLALNRLQVNSIGMHPVPLVMLFLSSVVKFECCQSNCW